VQMASLIDLFKVPNYLTVVNFARSNLDSQVEHKFYDRTHDKLLDSWTFRCGEECVAFDEVLV
jgi:hypothetical protein